MEDLFLSAKPIWIANMEEEMNCRVQFKAKCAKTESAEIHIATSGIYQLWINGKFISYGPARAGKNHFRMEKINLAGLLTESINTIVIEVAGYFCRSFYLQEQPSFMQAEIISDGKSVICTGKNFSARINPYYYKKIQRYSYQRPFAESYNFTSDYNNFLINNEVGNSEIIITENKKIIDRKAPYPDYEIITAKQIHSGKIELINPSEYKYDRYCLNTGLTPDKCKGWTLSELECIPEKDYQEMHFTIDDSGKDCIENGRFCIYRFPYNATGMVQFDVDCNEPSVIYISGDEIFDGEKINPTRVRVCNIIRYELAPGKYHIHTFEVYTMQYIQISCKKGHCEVSNIKMTEYKHTKTKTIEFADKDIQLIADASVETFRQNAVDIFTDCPSRERAGWLCDSYFLAKAEHTLTGQNIIEESFLENFLHEDGYDNIPKGMLPMCYPGDFLHERYIPNWAMWFVVELEDYYKRTGKTELIDQFKSKVYGLIKFFQKYENSDGLLENLESWVFVEWSRANDDDMVSGVNYPSNMMYYAMLNAAYVLYNDVSLKNKAKNIKEEIIKQSFDGTFFADHAEKKNDKLVRVPESTEVCQYYALFCNIVDKKSHPDFFNRMVWEFGPNRDIKNVWKNVYPAAPFIGNYLRIEILMRYGYTKKVLENIKDYFLQMAKTTGTLWEKAETTNSCNHGFASCVIAWLEAIER